MRKLYDKLLKLLNISGSDHAVFLLALLLAFSIWLIHNLSLKYNDYLTSPVVAKCNIEGHRNQSLGDSDIVARCRATGYTALTSRIKRKPVEVTFDPSIMHHKNEDLFYILSEDLTEYAHLIYGEGVTLDYFVTDTVFFRFPEVEYKKVPVYPVYNITFKEQYMNREDFKVIPDSVTLYGEASRLSTIDRIVTEPLKYSSVSSDIQGIAKLKKVKDIRMSVEEVHYSLDVCRFVEMSATLPVTAVNVPSGKKLQIFPSRAKVCARFTFPIGSEAMDNLELQVDYNDFINSLSGKCFVTLSNPHRELISYEVEPVAVECVLEDW